MHHPSRPVKLLYSWTSEGSLKISSGERKLGPLSSLQHAPHPCTHCQRGSLLSRPKPRLLLPLVGFSFLSVLVLAVRRDRDVIRGTALKQHNDIGLLILPDDLRVFTVNWGMLWVRQLIWLMQSNVIFPLTFFLPLIKDRLLKKMDFSKKKKEDWAAIAMETNSGVKTDA